MSSTPREDLDPSQRSHVVMAAPDTLPTDDSIRLGLVIQAVGELVRRAEAKDLSLARMRSIKFTFHQTQAHGSEDPTLVKHIVSVDIDRAAEGSLSVPGLVTSEEP